VMVRRSEEGGGGGEEEGKGCCMMPGVLLPDCGCGREWFGQPRNRGSDIY
jgi:hypothetical protein